MRLLLRSRHFLQLSHRNQATSPQSLCGSSLRISHYQKTLSLTQHHARRAPDIHSRIWRSRDQRFLLFRSRSRPLLKPVRGLGCSEIYQAHRPPATQAPCALPTSTPIYNYHIRKAGIPHTFQTKLTQPCKLNSTHPHTPLTSSDPAVVTLRPILFTRHSQRRVLLHQKSIPALQNRPRPQVAQVSSLPLVLHIEQV
jgi:hypothetical protein